MCAFSVTDAPIDPAHLAEAKRLIHTFDPHVPPERLERVARMVALKTQEMKRGAATLEEFKAKVESLREECAQKMPPQQYSRLNATLAAFREEQPAISKEGSVSQEQFEEKIEEALARSVVKGQQAKTCWKCLTPDRVVSQDGEEAKNLLKRCSLCKKAMYCSSTCQGQDWPRHKEVDCLHIQK